MLLFYLTCALVSSRSFHLEIQLATDANYSENREDEDEEEEEGLFHIMRVFKPSQRRFRESLPFD